MAFQYQPSSASTLPLPYAQRQSLSPPSSEFQYRSLTTGAPQDDQGILGPIDIFGNLLEEGKQILLGIGPGLLHVGRSIINDTIGTLQEVFSGGRADPEFMLDDVGVTIANDFKERWGPLFEGDVLGFLEQMGKRPLSFLLDALAVGGVAVKGAAVASQIPSVERGLAQIAAKEGFAFATDIVRRGRIMRAMGSAVSNQGRVAGLTKSQFITEYNRLASKLSNVRNLDEFDELPQWIAMHGETNVPLKTIAPIDTLENGILIRDANQLFNERLAVTPSGLTKYVSRLLPKTHTVHIPGTEHIVQLPERVNPLVRAISNPYRTRYLIRPIDELADEIATARVALELNEFQFTPAQKASIMNKEDMLTTARMRGATHYATEQGSSKILTYEIRKLMGGTYGRQTIMKQDRFRALSRILEPVMRTVEGGKAYWESKRVAENFLGINDDWTTPLPGLARYELGPGELQLLGGAPMTTASRALYGEPNPALISDEATAARYEAAQQFLGPNDRTIGPLDQQLREAFEIDDDTALNIYGVADPRAPMVRLKGREAYDAKAGFLQGPPEDMLGMRVVVPGVSAFKEFTDKFRQLFPNARLANHIGTPAADGYVGVKGYVNLPGDVSLEVQFVLPSGYKALRAGEPMYQALREMNYSMLQMSAAHQERLSSLADQLASEPNRAEELAVERTKIEAEIGSAVTQHEMVAHRYRNLWNLSRYEVGRELLDVTPDPGDLAREEMRLWMEENETADLIRRGIMSIQQIVEHEYLAPRIVSGAHFDGRVGAMVEGASTTDIMRYRDNMNLPSPIYFPTFDTRRAPLLSSLFTRHGDLQRPPRASFQQQSKGVLLGNDIEVGKLRRRITGEDITDLQEMFLRNPLEAYMRHANEVIKVQEAWATINHIVNRYGVVLENLQDFDPSTQSLVIPEALHSHFRVILSFEDAMRRGLEAGFAVDDAAASAVKRAFEDFDDSVKSTIIHSTVGVRANTMYAVPKIVGDRFNEYFRTAWGHLAEQHVRVFWDTPVGAWRNITLAGSPRWWVNNVLGETLFLKLQGGKLTDALQLVWDNRKKNRGVDTYLRNQIRRLGLDEEAIVAGHYAENDLFMASLRSASTPSAQVLARLGESKVARGRYSPVRVAGRALRGMRNLNALWETAFREAGVITALEQRTIKAGVRRVALRSRKLTDRLDAINARGLTEELVSTATDDMLKFHGDYATLAPIERRVIRRFIAPFWSWYRHTARLTFSMLADDALRAQALAAVAALDKDLAEDVGPMPEWLRGSYPITPIGPFIGTRGSNPFATPAQLVTQPASLLNPLFGTIYEMSFGRQSFTGRPFTRGDVVTPFGSDQQFQVLYDDNGVPNNVVPIDKVTPSWLEALVSTVPQYDLVKDLFAAGARYSAPGLLEIGTIMEKGQIKFPASRAVKLARFFGFPYYDNVDIVEWQARLDEDARTALTQAINQAQEQQQFLNLFAEE